MRIQLVLSGFFVGSVALAGCGHPASEAECQEILDRVVDLELRAQNVTDPAEIKKRRAATLSGMGSGVDATAKELHDGCVGKHITDRAMDCVRAAKSADEITDHCLQ